MDKRWRIGILVLAVLVLSLLLYKPPETRTPSPIVIQENQSGPFRVEEDDPYWTARRGMVEGQLKTRDITDGRVLEVMGAVQRHEFVPDSQKGAAYEDHPLPIGEGQTISQPYIVALMTQSLNLSPGDRVLEIGTGSGYQAAVLAEIVDDVYTIEIIGALAEEAESILDRLGYDNARVKHADGYYGWEEYAPFDSIIVTAAASHVPPPLLEQLKDGGSLVIPLGSTRYYQTLTLIEKNDDDLETTYITSVRFVPMTGRAMEG